MTAPHAVLGLSALAHDPAACLFVDGRLVAAVEEERLCREKNTTRFPHCAIDFVLAAGGLAYDDLDEVAYYWDDVGEVLTGLWCAARAVPRLGTPALRLLADRAASIRGPRWLARELRRHVRNGRGPRVRFVNHHHSHAAAAWYTAPFAPDAALVIDGRGEHAATSTYCRWASAFRCDEVIGFPNSLGVFFGAVTQQLGYEALADEYKVMGLAAWGRDDRHWRDRVNALLTVDDDGTYYLDPACIRPERCSNGAAGWLSERGRELLAGDFGPPGEHTDAGRNLAFAAQRRIEEAVLGLGRRLHRRSGGSNLVIAGGVALNGCAIGRVRAESGWNAIHVPVAPNDSGACIGAALAVLGAAGRAVDVRPDDPFLGPSFGDDDIVRALELARWPRRRVADPARAACDAILAGDVVGWFQGPLEFGARALGARSILADPRRPEMRDHLNRVVKGREDYRPFAPSVLEEHASEWFAVSRCRLMNEVARATPRACREVPAVVHVDGTARPQTVPGDWPIAGFRRLIELFHAATAVPMVVNTSFNVRGEPIVATPTDALRCFAACGLDTLVIGPYVLRKEGV